LKLFIIANIAKKRIILNNSKNFKIKFVSVYICANRIKSYTSEEGRPSTILLCCSLAFESCVSS